MDPTTLQSKPMSQYDYKITTTNLVCLKHLGITMKDFRFDPTEQKCHANISYPKFTPNGYLRTAFEKCDVRTYIESEVDWSTIQ
jgi:hypothetical protein